MKNSSGGVRCAHRFLLLFLPMLLCALLVCAPTISLAMPVWAAVTEPADDTDEEEGVDEPDEAQPPAVNHVDEIEGYTPSFVPTAQGVYLYNLDAEEVIYAKNKNEVMYPASLTKIMTCILALENTNNLATEKVVYPQYVQDYLYNYQYVQGNGMVSNAELMAREELTMKDALYALMLPSGNEVAMTIADHVGGSQEGFAAMMNARARELGALNTNFVNANGLFDPNHVTTPYDMALITRHAMELPGFMDIVNTTVYECPPTNIHPNGLVWSSTNLMMSPGSSKYYYAPVQGVKTGSLPEAGYCFVSTAAQDGFTYLLVVMGAPMFDGEGVRVPERTDFLETKNFYEWVFSSFRVKTLVDKGKHVADIPLRLCQEQDRLRLMTAERFTALLPEDVEVSQVEFEAKIPEFLNAPVEKHTEVGEVTLWLAGKEIGRVPLLAAETVVASPMLILLEKVKEVLRSFWFKFAVTLLVLLIVAYIALMIVRNRNRSRSSRNNYRPRRRM